MDIIIIINSQELLWNKVNQGKYQSANLGFQEENNNFRYGDQGSFNNNYNNGLLSFGPNNYNNNGIIIIILI